MAQLPPKFPSSWSDEFFDFTSAKRGSHRRTVSDSVTLFESPRADIVDIGYDRLDEEELMSMFSDELEPELLSSAPPSTAPSTTSSDHNSFVDQEKQMQDNSLSCDQCEGQSGNVICDENVGVKTPNNPLVVDAKKAKRILANRQSAQRSRVRKLQYISDLEKTVSSLQTEVSSLQPRVAFFDEQRQILSLNNSNYRQNIALLIQDKLLKEVKMEALQNEIERLKMLYNQQQMKKRAAAGVATSDGPPIDVPGGTKLHPSS